MAIMLISSSSDSKWPWLKWMRKLAFGAAFWMLLASAAALLIIAMLVRPTHPREHVESPAIQRPGAPGDYVQVTGPRQILVKPGTPRRKSLGVVTVTKETVAYPLLTVTGSVVARIRPGSEPLEERLAIRQSRYGKRVC